MARKAKRRGFGKVRRLPSGMYQASYPDPVAGSDGMRHNAPHTFTTKEDAEGWLLVERRLIDSGDWTSPKDRRRAIAEANASRAPLFADYAARWVDTRRTDRGARPLANHTKYNYQLFQRQFIVPTFGHLHLDEITPGMVNTWYDELCPNHETQRARIYSHARSVMNTAVSAHGPMPGAVNPFSIRGAGSATYKRRDDYVLTSDEMTALLDTMRDDRKLMVLLATWCGMRFGELAALRRNHVDLKAGVIRIRESVDRTKGEVATKGPKSDAGIRDQRIPASVLPELKRHLSTYVTGREGLLFPSAGGTYLARSAFYGKPTGNGWVAAQKAAGLKDGFHFHDLRATGATLLAQAGATEAELQAWLGDSTPQAAARYARAARSRMDSLTAKLSDLHEGGIW